MRFVDEVMVEAVHAMPAHLGGQAACRARDAGDAALQVVRPRAL